jgi:hypothetical protein
MNISRYAHQTVLEIPLPRLRGKEAIRLTGLLYDLAATLEDYYRDAIAEAHRARPEPPSEHDHDRPVGPHGWRHDGDPF